MVHLSTNDVLDLMKYSMYAPLLVYGTYTYIYYILNFIYGT